MKTGRVSSLWATFPTSVAYSGIAWPHNSVRFNFQCPAEVSKTWIVLFGCQARQNGFLTLPEAVLRRDEALHFTSSLKRGPHDDARLCPPTI